MTSIQRNFNGVIYKVTVKEEEQRRRMAEREDKEGGEVTLEKPKVTEVDTAPSVEEFTEEASSVETPSVKVIDLCFFVKGSQPVLRS